MAISSTSEYKSYAGISATTWDSQLNVIIPAVQMQMERWCGRKFDTETFDEYMDGTGSDVLTVKNPPIASITSIRVYVSPTDSPTATSSDDYTFDPDTGIIRLQPSYTRRFPYDSYGYPNSAGPQYGIWPQWPKGFRNIRVIYIGGFGSTTATPIPLDLKLALHKIVDTVFSQAKQDLTVKSESLGSYSYTRADPEQHSAFIQSLMSPYRRTTL